MYLPPGAEGQEYHIDIHPSKVCHYRSAMLSFIPGVDTRFKDSYLPPQECSGDWSEKLAKSWDAMPALTQGQMGVEPQGGGNRYLKVNLFAGNVVHAGPPNPGNTPRVGIFCAWSDRPGVYSDEEVFKFEDIADALAKLPNPKPQAAPDSSSSSSSSTSTA